MANVAGTVTRDLRSASQLIKLAAGRLNTKGADCRKCKRHAFDDLLQSDAAKELHVMATRLVALASELDAQT